MKPKNTINQRLQQVIEVLGWSQEYLATTMVTNPSTVSRWLNGKPISKTSIKRFLQVTNAAEEFVLNGQGEMFIASSSGAVKMETDTGAVTAAGNEAINVHEGMMMAARILSSPTGYAQSLWAIIQSFDEAVAKEEKVKDLEKKIDELLKGQTQLQDKHEKEMKELKELIKSNMASTPEKKSLAS